MSKLACIFSLLLVSCASAVPAAPATPLPTIARPTAAPAPTSTTPPFGPALATKTSTTSADYKAITQPLLLPLGALIVAVRGKTPTTTYWLAEFNKAADKVLPAIEGDQSVNANRLRTSIANIRAMPNNLQVLEDSRSMLLAIG